MEGYGENVVLITIGRGPPERLSVSAQFKTGPSAT